MRPGSRAQLRPRRGLAAKVAARVGAALLGAVAAVAFGEAAVRWLPFDLPPGVRAAVSVHDLREIILHHHQLGYALRPGCDAHPLTTDDFVVFRVSTSAVPGAPDQSVGFRERFDGAAPWAVMVGDSFAMGWGVERDDTLEQVLERAVGRRVLNFGVCGQGPQQAMLVLQEFALRTKPRVVIWVIYPNDTEDAVDFLDWQAGLNPWWRPKTVLDLWLNRYSALYKLYRLTGKPRSANRPHYDNGNVRHVFSRYWKRDLDLRRERPRRGYQLLCGELDRFAALAAERGFTPVVVLAPYREQVYYEEYASVDPDVPPRNDPDSAYQLLLARLRAAGIATCDLEPVLRQHKDRQIYFVDDPHLTAEGNRAAGRHLADFLAARGLLE